MSRTAVTDARVGFEKNVSVRVDISANWTTILEAVFG
jgi:hypothetical protein